MIKIRKFFESIFENLGLVMAPLPAATLNGLSIYHFFATLIEPVPAGIIGGVFTFAIEATGYMSFVAYQKDKDVKKPAGYLVAVIVMTTTIELFVFEDWKRWMIGLGAVAIAGIMYWSSSSSTASINQLEADIIEAETLRKAGYKRNAKGQLVAIKSAPKQLQIDSKTAPIVTTNKAPTHNPKRSKIKRMEDLTADESDAIVRLGYVEFCSEFRAISQSSFYLWKKTIKESQSVS